MFKNKFVQMLVDIRKSGTDVFLTDEGYRQFLLMIHHESFPVENEDHVKAI